MIGISTGALARGDFQAAIDVLRRTGVEAIELSALREDELPPLARALPKLDLSSFRYVSVHAPSHLSRLSDLMAVEYLETAVARDLPIVLHPDVIRDFVPWRRLGASLLVENMDKRKATGRTVSELRDIFDCLPSAGLCFDFAHARQIDPTMVESTAILRFFGGRLRQMHLSEVNSFCKHARLTASSVSDFRIVRPLIDLTLPIILETPLDASQIADELSMARLVVEDRHNAPYAVA
jgi:hypothetical protein